MPGTRIYLMTNNHQVVSRNERASFARAAEGVRRVGAAACSLERFGKAGEVAAVIVFLASRPASYATQAQYPMGGEWKRESAATQDVDGTWHGRERTMKDTEARRQER